MKIELEESNKKEDNRRVQLQLGSNNQPQNAS